MSNTVSAPLVLSQGEFNQIKELVLSNTGINLSDSKMELVKRRFSPRIKELGLGSFSSYVDYVAANYETEGSMFCNAITTNLTSFFREKHHYEYLSERILPEILQNTTDRRIRIWSAGCSTGQEAYCLAITATSAISDIGKYDLKILATDLDENCLNTARSGSYPKTEFAAVPQPVTRKFFSDGFNYSRKGRKIETYVAKHQLKSLITFNKLNLMHSWPMKGKFDVIFCRNVFIYFNKETQLKIVQRFSQIQKPGSYLCLGHSETIPNAMKYGYALIGKTLYRRL